MELIAGICAGSLGTLLGLLGFVAYVTRGHRISLEGVRVVRSDQWRPPSIAYTSPADYAFRLGAESREFKPAKEPDLYDQAHGRDDE